MKVLDALKLKRGLTETEAALADYILAHADDVPSMTIRSLAQISHCSGSSIVRLCQKLGLDEYRELRLEIVRELEHRRSSLFGINPDRPFIEGSSTADISSSIAALSKQAIDATYASTPTALIKKAARLLLDSRRVVYYALGDSCASVEVFTQLLYKIGVVCANGMPKGDQGVFERTLDPHDLAFIVSHSGNLIADYAHTIDTLRASGCKTIVITANPSLEERLMGTDCLFLLPQGENRSERLATFYSQECIRYVLNCIYAEAFSADYQQNLEHWQESERIHTN